MEQASPPRGCVIQSPLYWLILRVCGILLLILFLFWLLFSKWRQLVKSLGVPFKKKTKHPLSEECTLVFVSSAQFVFVTTVTFIPHLLSRFTVFSSPARCVFSKYLFRHSASLFVRIQSKELWTTKSPTERSTWRCFNIKTLDEGIEQI